MLKQLAQEIDRVSALAAANEAYDDDIVGLGVLIVEAQRYYSTKELCPDVVKALEFDFTKPSLRGARVALAAALAALPRCSGDTDTLTPPDVAKRLGVKPATVIGWIKSGQLKGSNIGKGSRPRYRVTPDDLAAFLKSRQSEPPRKVPKAKPSKPSRF